MILASAAIDLPGLFVQIAEQVQKGTYRAGVTHFGLKTGVISLVLNPKLANRIPASIQTEIEEARKKIIAGELVVPRNNF